MSPTNGGGEVSGGVAAADALAAFDVDVVFTLSGGHIFPLFDGCVQRDIRLVDTRHEQTATFAAEGWAKVTRRPGVVALTAGPGITNGISAITAASLNGSPILVIGGRAPAARWGVGSLQELDPLPILASVTKSATTATEIAAVGPTVAAALATATTPHRGPTFVDVALDVFFELGPEPADLGATIARQAPDPDALVTIAGRVARAERPVLVVGADVYWGHAEDAMRAFVETARVPVIVNGLGRGTIPSDHELAFSRARSAAFRNADLVVVAGTPLDFRLGFGEFGAADVIHIADSSAGVATHVDLAAAAAGDLDLVFTGLIDAWPDAASTYADHDAWVARLTKTETAARAGDVAALESAATPIHPLRIYGELRSRLERDAIVIGDGGDFVSYAGKYVDTFTPGCFLDPGPYGCLGTGPGYALAAALARPDRQVVLLLGDGATGFSLGDFDTLVRFGVNVVAVIGNNGIWGLEKHPMQAVYGYDVAAELTPGTRYDQVAEALGGSGELVTEPDSIGPALDRAFAHDGLSVVNVLTDPSDAYPRSSNLA